MLQWNWNQEAQKDSYTKEGFRVKKAAARPYKETGILLPRAKGNVFGPSKDGRSLAHKNQRFEENRNQNIIMWKPIKRRYHIAGDIKTTLFTVKKKRRDSIFLQEEEVRWW